MQESIGSSAASASVSRQHLELKRLLLTGLTGLADALSDGGVRGATSSPESLISEHHFRQAMTCAATCISSNTCLPQAHRLLRSLLRRAVERRSRTASSDLRELFSLFSNRRLARPGPESARTLAALAAAVGGVPEKVAGGVSDESYMGGAGAPNSFLRYKKLNQGISWEDTFRLCCRFFFHFLFFKAKVSATTRPHHRRADPSSGG